LTIHPELDARRILACRRIVITGNSGSGKSTFAAALGRMLGHPVVHLDLLYWSRRDEPVPAEQFEKSLQEVLEGDCWILEGFHIPTFHMQLEAADAVVLLDVAPWRCVARLLWAVLERNRRLGTPDAAEALTPARLWGFLRWVWIYPSDRRPGTIAAVREARNAVVLRSPRHVRRFLAAVESGSRAAGAFADSEKVGRS
jgi:adenylate kinase family enzyme